MYTAEIINFRMFRKKIVALQQIENRCRYQEVGRVGEAYSLHATDTNVDHEYVQTAPKP